MTKKQESSFWLDTVRKFERAIGVPVESAVTSDAYFDMLTKLKRVQAEVEKRIEGATGEWFRLLNLPAGSDIRRMHAQLSRMERRLDALAKEIARRDSAGPTDEVE